MILNVTSKNENYYGTTGLKNVTKVWTDILTPSTSDGYSIDISSAGFTQIISVHVSAAKNTSTANLVPNVSIKTVSTTAITVNITEGNQATVVILGINVLSGAPMVFADVTGLTLYVTVMGI